MIKTLKKVATAAVATAAVAAIAFALTGCGASSDSSNSSDSTSAGSASSQTNTNSVVIGTLATEDILPMWVAQEEGLFAEHGVDATVTTFQSATELIAAVTAGDVDYAMTDPMVTASIYASGTDVQIEWVTLGTTAQQGRFGIMTADSSIKSLEDLAGKEIGVGSNTILEYVMDTLMTNAGVSEDDIKTSELQKLPVRYQAMASGQVAAAALPASLLALGEASGYTVVADDTTGDNISQSVMIARTDALEADGGQETLDALKAAWDDAAGKINADGDSCRELLATNANLSDELAKTYKVSEYPTCQLPAQEQIDNVLTWMKKKGYLTVDLTYDAATGQFSKN